MRIRKEIFTLTALLAMLSSTMLADVRIKQKVVMGGQTFESVRSIKGTRERTEQKMQMDDPEAAAFMPQTTTVTQCDLKRTIRINDRKRLYLIEPFAEVETGAVTRTTPARPQTTTTRRGGTMTITYSVKDTGERKTMFGLQARHLIVTHEVESSADSCNGPSRSKIEYDGWYVDFSADFSCPTSGDDLSQGTAGTARPDCRDRVITKGTAGRTGFLLQGTMKIYGADGTVQMTQLTETLELSRAPLDAALFDIPAGYQLASSAQDLYSVTMPMMGDTGRNDRPAGIVQANRTSKSVAIDLVFPANQPATRAEAEQYIRNKITGRGLRAASGTGDYVLRVEFRQVKESAAGKIGGIFGKVTGVETKAGKVDIDMTASLSGASSGEAKVKSKFEGPLTDAVRAAIDQALDQLLVKVDQK